MDKPHISGDAVIITGGLLADQYAKSAHGLLRTSNRFKIKGVIDHVHAGKDAGEVLFGQPNGVMVFDSLQAYIDEQGKPEYGIIGMATKGGRLSEELYPLVEKSLKCGLQIINGLHQPLKPIFQELIDHYKGDIHDIRKPAPFEEMHFWKGDKVLQIKSLIVPVLGLDCAVGKRTTSRILVDLFEKNGQKAEMLYSGQTGWMQGGHYGFLFDATPNDFISGELEYWLHKCWEEQNPDVIIIEGQSGLRNPSGPCGLEFILSGRADGIILQAKPSKTKYKGLESYPVDIPDILDEVDLLERFGVPVISLTLNGEGFTKEELAEYRDALQKRTSLPVCLPLQESLTPILEAINKLKK